jgi:intein/homing endonuclease
MADNTQKAIKDVKIGDYVITVDPNTCKQSVTKVINQYVRETEKQIISIQTESGRKITCTYDHPVLTSTGWKTADIAEDICVIPQQVIYEDGGCDLEIKYEHSLQKILIKRVAIPIFARMIGYFISCGNIKTNIKYSCYEFVFNSKNGLQDFIKDISMLQIDRRNFLINNRDNSSYHVIFINEAADLITSLLEEYTYKNIKIPTWIKNGSKLIKREFLAGFQGGSGGKLSITNDSFRLLDTSLIYITGNISILTKEIVELFEELGIKCGNARFSNSSQFVRLSFENTVENCINYFERIGWRYNNSNYNESLPVYEYCKKVIKDREDNAQIEESCWCFFGKKKVSIYEGYLKWKREVKDKAIFVKIVKRVKEEGTMIADITTESENHSFIAGDSFCVHNSAMGKQAMSMYALSHLVRSDTITHVLTYPQKPLVSTKSADMLGFSDMPSGMNTIVAVACYTGLTV